MSGKVSLGATAVVMRDGKILLTKREDFEVWCLPGGHTDPGESVAETARRLWLIYLGLTLTEVLLLMLAGVTGVWLTLGAFGGALVSIALVFGLAQLGFSLGPLLAGFGVVGFILGFAMQDSLSNLAAGMMILINRPYDVGDLVDVAGAFGKVEKMSLVSTGILTLDNQKLVVPNSKIWGDVIKNVTAQTQRRVDMTFGISYSDDIPKAETILEEILAQNERVLDDPQPVVRLHNLGDSSVDFVVRPWVKTEDYWTVYWDLIREVKLQFDAQGISIPFPQRDLHIKSVDPVIFRQKDKQ